MTKLRWFLATAMVLLFAAGEAQAQEINEEQKADSTQQDTTGMKLQVTLVTCDPGPDAYQMFGHTAIRIKDLNNPDYDLVYNYGVFDSRRDNFIYYFVKGETDYVLSVDPARLFLDRYTHRFGIPMREQFLNINDQEKLELTRLLEINARPDNRTYRYNFLYDNCTTRATNIIEKALEKCGVQLKYETKSKEYEKTTFRQVLHRFTAVAPWTEFGIDFVLGAEVDKPRSQREQMFIPSVYEAELDKAQMVGQDGDEEKYRTDGGDGENTRFPTLAVCHVLCRSPLCHHHGVRRYQKKKTFYLDGHCWILHQRTGGIPRRFPLFLLRTSGCGIQLARVGF